MTVTRTFFLVTVLTRLRGSRALAWLAALAALIVTLLYVFMQSTTLSPAQVNSSLVGTAQAVFSDYTAVHLGESPKKALVAAEATVRKSGADSVREGLRARPLQGPTVQGRNVAYWEESFADDPFPGRLQLLTGTWPSRAGEVCVSPPLQAEMPLGSTQQFFAGALHGKVTCVAKDLYAARDSVVMAAPGTWAGAHLTSGAGRWDITANVSLFWSGGDVATAADHLLSKAADTSVNFEAGSSPVTFNGDVSSSERGFNVSPNPWLLLLPSILFPAALAALGAVLVARSVAPLAATLHSLGVRRSAVRNATVTMPVVVALVAAVLGWGCGLVLGLLGRAVAARLGTNQPLGPVTHPAALLGVILVAALVGVLVGSLAHSSASVRSRRSQSAAERRSERAQDRAERVWPVLVWVSLVTSVVCLVAGAHAGTTARSMGGLITTTALVALSGAVWIPVLVGWLCRRPGSGAATVLARRQLRGKGSTFAIAALFTFLSLVAVNMLTLATSFAATATADLTSVVPAGQARMEATDPAQTQVLPRLADQTADLVPRARRVDYSILDASTSLNDGPVYALGSVEDIAQMIGLHGSLDSGTRKALEDGAVLRAKSEPADSIGLLAGDRRLSAEVVVVSGADPSAGADGGYMLESTASREHLTANAQPGVAFVGLSAKDLDVLQGAPEKLAYSSSWLLLPKAPDPFTVPTSISVSSWLLSALFCLLSTVFAFSMAGQLRPLVARLRAIGLRRSWTRRVVAQQLSLAIIGPAAGGVVIGLLGVLVGTVFLPVHVDLYVPWSLVAVVFGGLVLGWALGLLGSHGRLAAAERLHTSE